MCPGIVLLLGIGPPISPTTHHTLIDNQTAVATDSFTSVRIIDEVLVVTLRTAFQRNKSNLRLSL